MHAQETTWKSRTRSRVLRKPPPPPPVPLPSPLLSFPTLLKTPSREERRQRIDPSSSRNRPPDPVARDTLLSPLVIGKKNTAQEQQAMEDCTDQSLAQRSTTPTGFFRVPGLFVMLSSKGINAVDTDSVWSPTSPLDFKSSTGSTNLKCPGLLGIEADDLKLRASPARVGLGLVDALTAGESSFQFGGKSSFLESIKPFLELALPKVASDAAACRDTGSVGADMDGIAAFAQSEEYTCVIERGPNPRTTHILGGQTLEVPEGGVPRRPPVFTVEPIGDLQPWPSPTPAGVASGLCSCCRKRLRQDRDVYMYLGEKAFCSNECRKGCIEEVELIMMLDSGSCSAGLSR